MMTRRPGFTLIDFTVSLAVLAVLMTVVYTAFAFQQKTVDAASEGRDVSAQGLIILDRLSRDIRGAWLPIEASESGRHSYLFAGGENFLRLTTTASLSPDQGRGPQIVEVGYRWENDPGDDDPDKLTLYRRQDDYLDQDPEDGGGEIVLSRDIVSLELAFVMGDEERTEASVAAAPRLPDSVRVTLVLSTVDGKEETFITLVSPPLARPAVKSWEIPSFGGGD